MVSQAQLTQQLLHLGVTAGGVLLVHCSFSQVKPIEHGPLGLIAALPAATSSSDHTMRWLRTSRGGTSCNSFQ
jgi:aminoglycoside N3'-acetyltransferase